MKKFFCYCLIKSAAIIPISMAISLTAFADQTVFVQVKESKVRTQPKIWAESVGSVNYGDSLQLQSQTEGWASVTLKTSKHGFIPVSALSDRKIILSSASYAGSSIDSADAVLAGKGFSSGTEKQFASSSGANFSAVNKMEAIKVTDASLRDFVNTGKLGGAK